MSRHEEATFARMRRNVRKNVMLRFKHYSLRVEASLTFTNGQTAKTVLPVIKLGYLKRWFIRDEVLVELQKIKKVNDADLHIEVFAVYGTERAIGEYERYLGELFIFMSNIQDYEHTEYRHKASKAYFEQPEKSDFIPERL